MLTSIPESFEFSPYINSEKSSLDVLLELIQKKKKDIRDLNIKELTDQFLGYVAENKDKVPLEVYSDYANMSAYLIELKTRSLLPDYDANSSKYQRTLEEEKEAFIRRLLEHQMYKNAIPLLEEYKARRELYFDKNPEDFDDYLSSDIPLGKLPKRIDINKLKEAFEAIIDRQNIKEQLDQPIDLHIANHEYSVTEVIYDLVTYLGKHLNGIFLMQYFDDLEPTRRNIDYYCMLFFVILSLIHQGYINFEEQPQGLFAKLSPALVNNQQISNEFIDSIKKELFGEE